jgi:glycosyltransferase involved in cell wall biosynthesis
MIAVVVPCYRARDRILDVLRGIGEECDRIFVVDDACPQGTGKLVEQECGDPRVRVLFNPAHQGSGGATLTGYRQAMAEGAEILVRLEPDGQMDPRLIPKLVTPLRTGAADYAKGNRFYDLDALRRMPRLRLVGNAIRSFASKLSTGYWNLIDPTNGFTALHARLAERIPLDKVSHGWFFESDLLFRLNVLRAVVVDVPMAAQYGDARGNSLSVRDVVFDFARKHARNTLKRIGYNYLLRNFSVASVEVLLGPLLLLFGVGFGALRWALSIARNEPASAGAVMLAALPVVGMQLLLAFLGHDIEDVPRDPVHPHLR